MSEIIKTIRLTLEPFTDRHISEVIVDWLNDTEVVRYSDNRHHIHSIDSARAYLRLFVDSPNFYWAIIVNGESPLMIGSITAYVDVNNLVADVGILIGDKTYWGGGYGSEALSGALSWLCTERCIRKITVGTMVLNAGMLGIMRKLGMREEGRKERYYLFNGLEVDMICGSIFSKDWLVTRPDKHADN